MILLKCLTRIFAYAMFMPCFCSTLYLPLTSLLGVHWTVYLMIQYVHAYAYGYCPLYLINDHNVNEVHNLE